jgi:hypothetical protein
MEELKYKNDAYIILTFKLDLVFPFNKYCNGTIKVEKTTRIAEPDLKLDLVFHFNKHYHETIKIEKWCIK